MINLCTIFLLHIEVLASQLSMASSLGYALMSWSSAMAKHAKSKRERRKKERAGRITDNHGLYSLLKTKGQMSNIIFGWISLCTIFLLHNKVLASQLSILSEICADELGLYWHSTYLNKYLLPVKVPCTTIP